MYDYYSVINLNTGEKVLDCGQLEDAQMIVSLNPANRGYRKNRFILDQVIDITSTTDKQLPGQVGLPSAKEQLPPIELQQKVWLPESKEKPVIL